MADSPPPAPHELYAYEAPVSLWAVVQTYVPAHELEEVKNILGESLVEQSLELHAEVCKHWICISLRFLYWLQYLSKL